MWVDAERGGLLLSGAEAEALVNRVGGALTTLLPELADVAVPRVAEAIAAALERDETESSGVTPAVLLEADEPTALQLVGLLRSHRRDRGADVTGLDDAATLFRQFTQR